MGKAWGDIKHGAYMQRMNEIPKLVASRTLTGPLKSNATLIDGDVAEAVAELKQQPGGDIEVYGSPTLVQTLMKDDIVDEYRIAVHPVVLGYGTTLFPQRGVGVTPAPRRGPAPWTPASSTSPMCDDRRPLEPVVEFLDRSCVPRAPRRSDTGTTWTDRCRPAPSKVEPKSPASAIDWSLERLGAAAEARAGVGALKRRSLRREPLGFRPRDRTQGVIVET